MRKELRILNTWIVRLRGMDDGANCLTTYYRINIMNTLENSIMSELVEKKLKTELQPLKDDIRDLKLMAENMIKPNIQLLAENYVPAAKRFERTSTRIESMETDIA